MLGRLRAKAQARLQGVLRASRQVVLDLIGIMPTMGQSAVGLEFIGMPSSRAMEGPFRRPSSQT
ncbi:hypothetical protein A4R29_05315 [Mesorhizobium ciceri biovar biserrulae]|nr:hypothetical protein A4R29_05315 [Mesorhizobium ciceri biovar biserrulae]